MKRNTYSSAPLAIVALSLALACGNDGGSGDGETTSTESSSQGPTSTPTASGTETMSTSSTESTTNGETETETGPPPMCDIGGDPEDPSLIADLSLTAPSKAPQLHLALGWTAPEVAGGGAAASYEIRYASTPIQSDGDFATATVLTSERTLANAIPTPAAPGSSESLEVIGLTPNTTYHFAIVALDANGTPSILCNAPDRATAKYEGYGFGVTGGGDGSICRVTNTDDSGAGSLRDCLFSGGRICASEPLTVVFDVGGEITLLSDILLDPDDCQATIDGSTAPDPGITIRKQPCQGGLNSCPEGTSCLQDGEFKIGRSENQATDNIILTYLRFRGNYELAWGSCGENSGATLGLQYHFSDLVLDHLTIRNGVDSAPDLWTGSFDSSTITISNSIMAWSNHPLTISDSGGGGSRRDISIHHNVLARSGERMPQIRFDTSDLDYRNNVVFDWEANGTGSYAIRIPNDAGQGAGARPNVNLVANHFIPGNGRPRTALVYGPGPGSQSSPADGDGGPAACTPSDNCAGCPGQGTVVGNSFMGELWVADNILPAGACDTWSTVDGERPIPADAQVTTDSAADLVDVVLPMVGTHFRTGDEQGLIDEIEAGA